VQQPKALKPMIEMSEDDRVIVVLGYHQIDADGVHGLSPACRAGVRRAEALAQDARPHAVIFTGWSSGGGPSEAEQMAAAWGGRADVRLICEPHASNTAENAVRSLLLLRELDGVREVEVVCSIRHFPRARFLFSKLYRQDDLTVRFRYVGRPLPSPALVLHELSSIARMGRDRRRARSLLATGEQRAGRRRAERRVRRTPA
jgi:uncharacterized SAM-binding protein YcdF (DUF218 family)